MINALIVAISLFKRSLKNRYSLLLYVALPILGLLLPIITQESLDKQSTKINIVIVDEDKSNVSSDFKEILRDKYKFNVYLDNYNEAKNKVVSNSVSIAIVIPKDFKVNIINNLNPVIEVIYLKENENTEWVKQLVNTYVSNLNIISKGANGEEQLFDKLYSEFIDNSESVKINSLDNKEKSQRFGAATLGFMILFMMMMTSNSFSMILEDRGKSVYTRIQRTATTTGQYIVGHVIWNGCLCLIQSIVLILVIKILRFDVGINLGSLFLILIIISIMSISVGILAVSFCKSEEQLPLINTLIVFPTCMLSGCLWPIEIMGERIQNLAYIFPQRYIFIIMEQLSKEVNIYSLVVNVIFIIFISIIIFTVGLLNINN